MSARVAVDHVFRVLVAHDCCGTWHGAKPRTLSFLSATTYHEGSCRISLRFLLNPRGSLSLSHSHTHTLTWTFPDGAYVAAKYAVVTKTRSLLPFAPLPYIFTIDNVEGDAHMMWRKTS